MTFDEFLALISLPNPSTDDVARAAAFMEGLSVEDLNALTLRDGVHPIFRTMLRNLVATRISDSNIDEQVTNVIRRRVDTAGPSM